MVPVGRLYHDLFPLALDFLDQYSAGRAGYCAGWPGACRLFNGANAGRFEPCPALGSAGAGGLAPATAYNLSHFGDGGQPVSHQRGTAAPDVGDLSYVFALVAGLALASAVNFARLRPDAGQSLVKAKPDS